jgi:hypothetical protein
MGNQEPVVITADVGAVRQDPATKSIAVRRDVPDGQPLRWAVMTINDGGHYGTDDEVAAWQGLVAATDETP